MLRGGVEIVDQLATEWKELDPEPFCGPEWIGAFIRSFAPRDPVLVVTVRLENHLCAVLPLIEEQSRFYGLPVKKLTSPSNSHSPRFDLSTKLGTDETALGCAVWKGLSGIRGWDLLELRDVPQGGVLERVVSAAQSEGYATGRWDSLQTPRIPLKNWAGGTDWWLQQRSGNLRHKLRRVSRKVAQDGQFTLRRVDRADPKALRLFYDLEQRGWKGKQGGAIGCDAETQSFYDDVARAAERNRSLSLYFLEWKGDTIAAHYGIEHHRCYYMLKTAYNESYREYAPGHLIIREVLDDCLKRRITEFDFTGPQADWKQQWASEVRPHAWHYIFNKGLKGRAAYLLKFGIRRLFSHEQDARA